MKKNILILLMFLSLLNCYGLSLQQTPRKIFLKLDDVVVKNGETDALPTLEYIVAKKIKASFGLVANRNDESILSVFSDYLNAEDENGDRLIEMWNHGYDHTSPEFDGTTYNYQKEHFEDANQILNNFFNIKMNTFGAPFNHTDETTNLVVSENSNYKVTYFQNPAPEISTGILNLKNRVNIENGTGKPDFTFFVDNYNKLKKSYLDYMVLQGHPNVWDENHLNEFKKIVDFLLSEGCEFELPYNFYLEQNSNNTHSIISQEITFPEISTKYIGDNDFSPEATSTSTLNVSYNSSNLDIAKIVDGKIHIVNAGTCIITASQIGNFTYKSANYVSRTLTIEASLDVKSIKNNHFNYLNPVSDFLIINSNQEVLSLKIFNITGQLILSSNFNNILKIKKDLKTLKKGTYYVLLKTSKGKEILKILKN